MLLRRHCDGLPPTRDLSVSSGVQRCGAWRWGCGGMGTDFETLGTWGDRPPHRMCLLEGQDVPRSFSQTLFTSVARTRRQLTARNTSASPSEP